MSKTKRKKPRRSPEDVVHDVLGKTVSQWTKNVLSDAIVRALRKEGWLR